jgi:hypothetical protein
MKVTFLSDAKPANHPAAPDKFMLEFNSLGAVSPKSPYRGLSAWEIR